MLALPTSHLFLEAVLLGVFVRRRSPRPHPGRKVGKKKGREMIMSHATYSPLLHPRKTVSMVKAAYALHFDASLLQRQSRWRVVKRKDTRTISTFFVHSLLSHVPLYHNLWSTVDTAPSTSALVVGFRAGRGCGRM